MWKAVRNIAHGQVFDENFLMAIATIGAFCVGEYPEGVAVMLFYQVGELFQSYSVGRSCQSIAALMDIRPDYANLEKPDGAFEQVDPEDVKIGDIIVVKAGEKSPGWRRGRGRILSEHFGADRGIRSPKRQAWERGNQRLYQYEWPIAGQGYKGIWRVHRG